MNDWLGGVSHQEILDHYGDISCHGEKSYWPKDTVLKRVAMLPEVLRGQNAEKKAFRIVIDYDPDFPDALVLFFYDDKEGCGEWSKDWMKEKTNPEPQPR